MLFWWLIFQTEQYAWGNLSGDVWTNASPLWWLQPTIFPYDCDLILTIFLSHERPDVFRVPTLRPFIVGGFSLNCWRADSDRPLLGVQSFDGTHFEVPFKKTPSLAGKKRDTVPDWLSLVRLPEGLRDCPIVAARAPKISLVIIGTLFGWPYFGGCLDSLDNLSWKIPHKKTGWTGSLHFPILGIFCITLWLNDGKPPHKGWRLWGTCKEPCWIFKLTRQHQSVGLDMFDARIGGWSQPPNPHFRGSNEHLQVFAWIQNHPKPLPLTQHGPRRLGERLPLSKDLLGRLLPGGTVGGAQRSSWEKRRKTVRNLHLFVGMAMNILGYPLVMTNSSPWEMVHRNRWFTY